LVVWDPSNQQVAYSRPLEFVAWYECLPRLPKIWEAEMIICWIGTECTSRWFFRRKWRKQRINHLRSSERPIVWRRPVSGNKFVLQNKNRMLELDLIAEQNSHRFRLTLFVESGVQSRLQNQTLEFDHRIYLFQ
jgi:hypothetical protein